MQAVSRGYRVAALVEVTLCQMVQQSHRRCANQPRTETKSSFHLLGRLVVGTAKAMGAPFITLYRSTHVLGSQGKGADKYQGNLSVRHPTRVAFYRLEPKRLCDFAGGI